MTDRSESKVALVTGGSSGIGRATALAFSRKGAKVVVADITVEGGEETIQLIRNSGGEASFVKTDVSKAREVEALITKAIDTYGRLDWAHNNAGFGGDLVLTADYSEETWDRVIDINLKAVWLCMKSEIPQMLKQGGGSIVNTSSIAGLGGMPVGARNPAYIASKHGVVGLTKVAALQYAQDGIRINVVCPGFINTPMVARGFPTPESLAPVMRELEPVTRLGTPEEVAEAVVWLCSDAASFVTGHTMVVDGGYTAK
jgi:NAD(P)-dependent dehydrogenase (short-subunit alcohol dehydrogenase family)